MTPSRSNESYLHEIYCYYEYVNGLPKTLGNISLAGKCCFKCWKFRITIISPAFIKCLGKLLETWENRSWWWNWKVFKRAKWNRMFRSNLCSSAWLGFFSENLPRGKSLGEIRFGYHMPAVSENRSLLPLLHSGRERVSFTRNRVINAKYLRTIVSKFNVRTIENNYFWIACLGIHVNMRRRIKLVFSLKKEKKMHPKWLISIRWL